MKILDSYWFSNMTQCNDGPVGIVRVMTDNGDIRYYLGTGIFGGTKDEDCQRIADLGSVFPNDAGDVLFGVTDDWK